MDLYSHLRVLISLILGLGINRILSGLSRLIQAPSWNEATLAHVVWALIVLLGSVHFWWWEFALRTVTVWYFGSYLVVLSYAFVMFLQASLLFPDVQHNHLSSGAYFFAHRTSFFAFFAVAFVIDPLDTALKGHDYLTTLGIEYYVRIIIALVIALLCARCRTPRTVAVLGLVWLAYDTSWIFRLYDILG